MLDEVKPQLKFIAICIVLIYVIKCLDAILKLH